MSLLQPSNKRLGKYRVVGASLPVEIHSYLTLYALAMSTTKTAVIKKQLEKWINEQKRFVTEEKLITSIVSQIQQQWKGKHKRIPDLEFERFKELVYQELIEKGVEEDITDKIVAKLQP